MKRKKQVGGWVGLSSPEQVGEVLAGIKAIERKFHEDKTVAKFAHEVAATNVGLKINRFNETYFPLPKFVCYAIGVVTFNKAVWADRKKRKAAELARAEAIVELIVKYGGFHEHPEGGCQHE
jgi:hypothetical protein